MDLVTVSGAGFLAGGVPFVPVGYNMTQGAVQRIGPAAYMKRAAGAGVNVLRMIWNPPIEVSHPWKIDSQFLADLQETSRAAEDYGIRMYPALIFPNPVNWATDLLAWPKNPFSGKYATPDLFYRNGVIDFMFYVRACLNALLSCPVFAVELVNELQVDSLAKYDFISLALEGGRAFPFLITFSRPTPYWQDTTWERSASEGCDFIAFHSYWKDALQWHVLPEPNWWARMELRERNVVKVCEAVKTRAQGKPFMDSEIPILPFQGPILDFLTKLLRRPKSQDFDSHFLRVGREYLRNGAASPGLQWSFTQDDITSGQLAQLKRLADGGLGI
jgi:hypothetical protein